MRGKNTIIINGRAYDAVTGQAIADSPVSPAHATHGHQSSKKVISDFGPATPRKQPTAAAKAAAKRDVPAAHAVHQKPQRSHTLHRRATKRPVAAQPQPAAAHRSPLISKFAPHPKAVVPHEVPQTQHVAPAPVVAKATTISSHAHTTAAVQVHTPQSASKTLKEQLIKERLSEAGNDAAHKPRGIKNLVKNARAKHVLTMCSALILIGAYFTYINMPNLSVRVASTRAGVAASYPEYRPDGYSFAGPVAYSPGEVTLKFKSNTNSQGFDVKQRTSNWDSQAVLDNVVAKESDSYLTYSEQGLTVYTYGKKAAWVNGGVLYTIDGDAPLSSEQILRIAASL